MLFTCGFHAESLRRQFFRFRAILALTFWFTNLELNETDFENVIQSCQWFAHRNNEDENRELTRHEMFKSDFTFSVAVFLFTVVCQRSNQT